MKNPRLHIALFNPEIPQNTGNVGRLCAWVDARLHLIRPLGFTISDRQLKRSGMDYWKHLDLHIHDNYGAFRQHPSAPKRCWLLTTHAGQSFWDADFTAGDCLLFGNEGHGAPDWLHAEIGDAHRITLPRFAPAPLRSLNLSTAVGIAAFEVLRQLQKS